MFHDIGNVDNLFCVFSSKQCRFADSAGRTCLYQLCNRNGFRDGICIFSADAGLLQHKNVGKGVEACKLLFGILIEDDLMRHEIS